MNRLKERLRIKTFQLIFELHDLVQLNPILIGSLLGIDYLLQVTFIVYSRIIENGNYPYGFILRAVDLEQFINQDLYKDEIDISLNAFLTLMLLYVFVLIVTSDENNPRKKGDAWKLSILLIVSYITHTGFSMFLISIQLINIQCPSPSPDFQCLKKQGLFSPIFCVFGGLLNILNSYFLESIYNFQFISIRGSSGILSNQKSLSTLPILLKYVAMGVYLSPLNNEATSIYFIIIAIINIFQLYLKFNYSFNFSKLLSEVDVIGQTILTYNYLLCAAISLLPYNFQNGDLILALILNPVLGYIVWALRRHVWNGKLYQNLLDIKSLQGQEIFIYRMIESIQKFDFEEQIILEGAMKHHKMSCENKKCYCRVSQLVNHLQDEEQRSLIVSHYLESLEGTSQERDISLNQQRDRDILAQRQDLPSYKFSSTQIATPQRSLKEQVNLDVQSNLNGFSMTKTVRYQGDYKQLKTAKQIQVLQLLLYWTEIIYQDYDQKRMKIIQAFIHSYLLGKDLQALYVLSYIENLDLSFQEKLALYTYQKIIFQKLNKKLSSLTNESLQIDEIQTQILFEKKVERFNHHVEVSIIKVQEIWNKLLKNHISTQAIIKKTMKSRMKQINQSHQQLEGESYNISSFKEQVLESSNTDKHKETEGTTDDYPQHLANHVDIDYSQLYLDLVAMVKSCSKVEKKFEKLNKIMPENLFLIVKYEIFLRQVLNYEYDSARIQQLLQVLISKKQILASSQYAKGQKKTQLIDQSKTLGVIIVSANSSKIGVILQANQNVLNFTGLRRSKLRGGNIASIIPEFITEAEHDKYIENFLTKNTKSSFINQSQALWLKQLNGFVKPVNVIIQPFYERERGLQFIAYLREIKKVKFDDCVNSITMKNFHTVVCDQNGMIVNCTEKFAFLYKTYSNSDLSYQELNIFQMSQDIKENTQKLIEQYQISKKWGRLDHRGQVQMKIQNSFKIRDQESSMNSKYSFSESLVNCFIRYDLRFIVKDRAYPFAVYYIAIDHDKAYPYDNFFRTSIASSKNFNHRSIQDEKELSNSFQDTVSQSMSSQTSHSQNNLQHLKNIKEDHNRNNKPRIVTLLQRYLISFLIVFLSLGISIIIMSMHEVSRIYSDSDLYVNMKHTFEQLAHIRNSFRDYVLIANNFQTNNFSVLFDRTAYLNYDIDLSLAELQSLSNSIKMDHSYGQLEGQGHSFIESVQIDSEGHILKTSQTLYQSLNQIYNKIQPYLNKKKSELACRGCQNGFQSLQQFSNQSLFRDLFYISQNAIDTIGTDLWLSSDIIQEKIKSDAESIQRLLIYLMIPGIIISIFGGVYFIQTFLRLTQNRKKVVLVVAKLKLNTLNMAQDNIVQANLLIKQIIYGERVSKLFGEQGNKSHHESNIDQENESLPDDGNRKVSLSEKQAPYYQSEQSHSVKSKGLYITQDANSKKIDLEIQELEGADQSIVSVENSRFGLYQYSQDDFQSYLPESAVDHMKKVQDLMQEQKELGKAQKVFTQFNIEKSFKSDRINMMFKLFPISLLLGGFFVTVSLINFYMIDNIEDGLNIIETFLDRDICLTTLQSYSYDLVVENKTNKDVKFIHRNLDELFSWCTSIQDQTTKIQKAALSDSFKVRPLIQSSESSQFCSKIDKLILNYYQKNLIQNKCSEASNKILERGISQAFTYVVKEFREFSLKMNTLNSNSSRLIDLLNQTEFLKASALNYVFLRHGLKQLSKQIEVRVKEHFQSQSYLILTISLSFIFVLLLLGSLVLYRIMNFVKGEIFFHKKIVKFIPIAELERKSISHLLKTFDY